MFGGFLYSPLHERTDCGWRRIEDRDAVLLDDRPESVVRRVVGHPLIHDLSGAIEKRSVHDVAVAGDPADVGGAPVHVFSGMMIEDVLEGVRHLREIPTRGVHDAFGLAGSARCVQQEQQLLGVHRFSNTRAACLRHQFVVPVVTARLHRYFVAAAANNHNVFDTWRGFERSIRMGLQRKHLTTAPTTIGRNQHFGLCIVNAVGQRLRGEPAKNDTVRRTDACTCKHCHNCFRNHRQIDIHAIARHHTESLEDIC